MLTVILGCGEMLGRRIENDPKALSALNEILLSADRASGLTRTVGRSSRS